MANVSTQRLDAADPAALRAAIDGLTQLVTVDQIARERGVEVGQVGYRPRVLTRRTETVSASVVEAV